MSQDNTSTDNTDVSGDDDVSIESGLNGVWIMYEKLFINPNTQEETTNCFWKVDANQKGTANPDPENARYAIFYAGDDDAPDAGSGKRKNVDLDTSKVFFVPWKIYDYLRCLGSSVTPLQSTDCYLSGYDWNRKYVTILSPSAGGDKTKGNGLFPWPDDATYRSSNYSSYFDKQFMRGQAWAPFVVSQLAGGAADKWIIQSGLHWRKSKGTGMFQLASGSSPGSDNRDWEDRSDGISFLEFEYLRLGITPRNNSDGAGKVLSLDHPQLAQRKIWSNEIYLLRGDMEALRAGLYVWSNPAVLNIRTVTGTLFAVDLVEEKRKRTRYLTQTFWSDAWAGAVAVGASKNSRFRNVDNLDMLFVLTKTARVTLVELDSLMKKIVEDAKKTKTPIKETATVVATNGRTGDLAVKYNYKLGLSPFEDFETWIPESSYIAYLEAYPGRELPLNEADALNAFKLDPKPKAKKRGTKKALAKKQKIQEDEEEEENNSSDYMEQMSVVSYGTIARASNLGRKTQPGQAAIMGGLSASVVAEKYKWQGSKVAGATTQNIVWNNPGVYAAEWLHRCAYSWGNEDGPGMNSIPKNFVFGSSEANSLMTRFERAWQSLLQKEKSYQSAITETQKGDQSKNASKGKKAASCSSCDLLTVNNDPQMPFSTWAVITNGNTKTLQEVTYKLKRAINMQTQEWNDPSAEIAITTKNYTNGVATTVSEQVLTRKDTTFSDHDYWGWSHLQHLICFSLGYEVNIPRLLNQNFGMLATAFYPFQRGFFTRLEAEIDQALLTDWCDKAKAKLKGTTSNANDTTVQNTDQSTNNNNAFVALKSVQQPQSLDVTETPQTVVALQAVQVPQMVEVTQAPQTFVAVKAVQQRQTMAAFSIQGAQNHGSQNTAPPQQFFQSHTSSQPVQSTHGLPAFAQGQPGQQHQDDHDHQPTQSRGREDSSFGFSHQSPPSVPPPGSQNPRGQADSSGGFNHQGPPSGPPNFQGRDDPHGGFDRGRPTTGAPTGPPQGPPNFHGRGDSPGGHHEPPSGPPTGPPNPHGQGPPPPPLPPPPPAEPKQPDISTINVSFDGVDTKTAAAWTAVAKSTPLEISGITVKRPRIATKDDTQALAALGLIKFVSASNTSAAPSFTVLRATAPTTPGSITQEADVVNTSTLMAVSDVPATSDDTSAVVPENFTVTGPIKLFGLFDAQLFSFHGDSDSGIRQIVPLSSDQLKFSTFLPSFADTPLDDISLKNTMFVYNEFTDQINVAGTWLSTEVVFQGALQPVSDAMSSLFGLKDPSLRLETLISNQNDWSQPFRPASIYFEGNIPGLSVKLGDLVEFTDLWVGINTGRQYDPANPGTQKFVWGSRFSGEARLTMPLGMLPLVVDFSVSHYNNITHLQLDASDDTILTKFCGIDGVDLSYLSLSVDFVTGTAQTKPSFTANATIELEDSTLVLSGRYSKDDWYLTCDLEDFDFRSLQGLYSDLFGDDLHITENEILVDDLSILLSSDGIVVEGEITIEGHTSIEASISISRQGFEISGDIDGGIATFGDITIESASFDVFIGRASDTSPTGPGTSWRFEIAGKVSVYGATISARAFLGKDQTGKTTWTIYGEFDGAVQLSHLIPTDPPELRQALSSVPSLDLSLTQVAFIASNVDQGAAVNTAIPADFTVIAGVQLLARLSGLPAFDKAMKNSAATPGMVVQIGYGTATSQFTVNIRLPGPQQTSMSGNVTSGPVTLGLEFGGTEQVVLMVRADFFYNVPNQTPLLFSGGLKVGIDSASLFVNMADGQMWTNPFGICPQLALGPKLGLQVGLVYAPPSVSGGVAGSFQFGAPKDGFGGQAAVSVSELPSQELLVLGAGDVGIIKMITFAANVLGQAVAAPTEEFLMFKKVEFYLSTGTSIGTLYYPPGASFTCDAVLFGVEANVACAINRATNNLSIKASLSAIKIGPLSVSGTQDGTNLVVDVDISPGSQTVLFDGKVTLLDFETYVYVNAELQPAPRFDLRSLLKFTDDLTFQINATTNGRSIGSMNQMGDFEFSIQAIMEQKILDFIQQRIDEQIRAAKHAADGALETAKSQVQAVALDYNGKVSGAQGKVDAAQKDFDARVGVLTQALTDAGKLFTDVVGQLFGIWQKANQVFQDLCGGLANALQNAVTAETIAIQNAMQAVSDAWNTASAKIDAASKDLANANQQMDANFGDANAHLKKAKSDVADCQSSVDSAQRDLDNAQNDLNNCEWYETIYYAGVVAEKGTVLESEKAGLAVAQGVLDGCDGFLNDVAYKAAQGAIDTCQATLQDVRDAGDKAVAFAKQEVTRITTEQQALVGKATDALHTAQTQSQELANSQQAQRDLDEKRAELSAGIDQAATNLANVTKEAVHGVLTAAKDGLNAAKSASKFLEAAEDLLEGLEEADDQILDFADWLSTQGTSVLNLRQIEVDGDLRGVCNGAKLNLHITGTVTNTPIDWSMQLLPGKGIDLIKDLWDKLLADSKSGVLPLQHRAGWVRPISRQEKSQTELQSASSRLAALQASQTVNTGIGFVTKRSWQQATDAISSAQASSLLLTDPQMAAIDQIMQHQTVTNDDFTAIVTFFPPPSNMSLKARSDQALFTAQDLLDLVNPWHSDVPNQDFVRVPSSMIEDYGMVQLRVRYRLNLDPPFRTFPGQDPPPLSSAQVDVLENFVNQWDPHFINTLNLQAFIVAKI